MGIWDKIFGRKKPRGVDESDEERSPGGSRVYRYDGKIFGTSNIGFGDEDVEGFREEREAAYEALFGESESVLHEVMPLLPHVDIYRFPPGHGGRDFWTLVTSGMSDRPMTLPDDIEPEYGRVELVFYCAEPRKEFAELLRMLAHFPHDNQTWLGEGHTMPNGDPPAPLFEDTPTLDTLAFAGTIVQPDDTLPERLVQGGVPVRLLWVLALTTAECEFKLERGMDELYVLLDRMDHSFVFQGARDSYV